jgi:hypothetical protein
MMGEKMSSNQLTPRLLDLDTESTNKSLLFFTQVALGATHACLLADSKVSDSLQFLNK